MDIKDKKEPVQDASPLSSPPSSPASPAPVFASPPPPPPSDRVRQLEEVMAQCARNVQAAKDDKSGKKYRVYCDGIYDLFHIGHMKMLEQAKRSLGDPEKVILVAGVNTDEDTHKFKGKTVMDHATRVESVRHCKWVDEVIPDAPWVLHAEFLEKHRIDFVAHDALPYKDLSGQAADGDVYMPVKRMGRFLETQRTKGISTTDLIVSILKDYDDYVKRNLARGVTKAELNVGTTWEIRAQAHDKKKKVQSLLRHTRQELQEFKSSISGFLSEFHPKYLIQQSEGAIKLTPNEYAQHLKTLPAHSAGVFHHSFGFARSLFEAGWACLSYCLPCCYVGTCLNLLGCGCKRKSE